MVKNILTVTIPALILGGAILAFSTLYAGGKTGLSKNTAVQERLFDTLGREGRVNIDADSDGKAELKLRESDGTPTALYLFFNETFNQTGVGIAGQGGRQFIITNGDDSVVASDHDHATPTNPTLFVHSATDPDSDNTEWVSVTHDQTNAVFGLGSGAYTFPDGNIGIGTSTVNTEFDVWESGTSTFQIDFSDNGSDTAMVLWNRADNSMVRVTTGVNDSGGTGFRALVIPNL